MTREQFDNILDTYIEKEQDYIREHNQIVEILKPLEGKPINGRTLNEKRLNGLKYVFKYGMHHIEGKYSHLIGYDTSENYIAVEAKEKTISEEGLTIPAHRGFEYLDACNGRAAAARIEQIKNTDKEKAFELFNAIETHFKALRDLFGRIEDEKLGSFHFPAYYSVLNSIYESKDRELKLTDFYFIRTNKK